MTTKVTTFSLRLPLSLKAAVEKLAEADGTSMNQFLVMAAAEKLTAMRTAEAFFADRRGRGDKQAAIRFLTRSGGEPPTQPITNRTHDAAVVSGSVSYPEILRPHGEGSRPWGPQWCGEVGELA